MTASAITFTVVFAAALVWAETSGSSLARVFKVLASTGFIAIALSVDAMSNTYGRLVLLGLAFSWIGDLLLTYSSRPAFLGGLVTFLLGHVAYSFAFGVLGVDARFATAAAFVLAAVATGVWRWLRPFVGDMAGPVGAYIVVISVMVGMAVGAYGAGATAVVPIGAALFYCSDIAVARNQFVSPGVTNRVVGLPLYYLAQILLASTAGG